MGRSTSIYAQVTEMEAALSGPIVWPHMAADHAVDRYIHRRPELAYLLARKRIDEIREKDGKTTPPTLVGVRFRRVYWDGGRHDRKGTQKFGHMINHEDPLKDVRRFLESLRVNLKRYMPDTPLYNCSMQLMFFDWEKKNEQVLAWQEKWL